MIARTELLLAFSLVLAASLLASPARVRGEAPRPFTEKKLEHFEKHVRPLLANKCFDCHGTDTGDGGLKLTSREAVLAGGDSGPVVVVGNPSDSLMLEVVKRTGKDRMPKGGDPLSKEEIAALSQWIEHSLPWPSAVAGVAETHPIRKPEFSAAQKYHWAFKPLKPIEPPTVGESRWPLNSVDAFVLAALKQQGLQPSAAADKRVLLRRVTFDLIGLPPTPDEMECFLADDSPQAYARVIDRLLDSPHYGERSARMWLDFVRYADNPNTDSGPQGMAWPYRDWVVRAFNDDLPYNRFIELQIAGDLLPPSELAKPADGVIAAGFLAIGNYSDQDTDILKQHAALIDDQIDTIGKCFLGLTLGCARCHDHKFDPLTTSDYYALAGIFRSTSVRDVQQNKRIRLTVAVPGLEPGDKKGPQGVYTARDGGSADAPWKGAVEDSPIFVRGDPRRLGPIVPRRFPVFFAGETQTPLGERTKGSGRLELARWIASRDNPLTARVIVNRLWQQHFGTGLTSTSMNFGLRGEPPTHPDLLDHLAGQFIDSGWSVKTLNRLIVLSATYRQSSRPSTIARERDPQNKWLSCFPRRRLEMEQIRDALLSVSGRLDLTRGGPAVKVELPRRTIYVATNRSDDWTPNDPFSPLFNGPEITSVVERRSESATAPQALYFMNSPVITSAANALAERLERDVPEQNSAARIRRAYELLYARLPSDRELKIGEAVLVNDKQWTAYCQILLAANEFLYVD